MIRLKILIILTLIASNHMNAQYLHQTTQVQDISPILNFRIFEDSAIPKVRSSFEEPNGRFIYSTSAKTPERLYHYGYFCKMEDRQALKNNGIQPRFRLGTLEYVNKIEGKKYY